MLVLAGMLALVSVGATSQDPNAVPYTHVPQRDETRYGAWTFVSRASGACFEQPRVDRGSYFEVPYTCNPDVSTWQRVNANWFWSERWLYEFTHRNQFNGYVRWCTSYWYSTRYEHWDRTNPFRVYPNWGDPLEKSPDGTDPLLGGHGCGAHGTGFKGHTETVRIQRQDSSRIEFWVQYETRSEPKTLASRKVAKVVPT